MSYGLKKILAVDDNQTNLSMIKVILSELYMVYTVNSAAMALDFLEKQHPDLILLDIEMPNMNGIELICIIKSDAKLSDIPVLFLTANPDNAMEATAFKLGAADYIRKPVNDIVLMARVKTHLELKAYRSLLGNS